MPHLHDMEELVNSIEDVQAKDYMKEAMSCYMANAYRACIVLTYIALFDDIVKKLGELGKVNKKAKNIYTEAQKRINSQDVYESYVIDQLKSNSLLPALDTSFLDTLRVLRNKSAHPSGHHASAEEARFIFYEAINRFLSKPILTTTQLVDEILARLDEKHFFPSTDISKISIVVKKEVENIHHEALPYLISKFLEKTLSTSSDVSRNAGFFLTGLAYLKEPETSEYIKKYVINPKCSDSKYSNIILRIISADGSLVLDLDPVTYDRLAPVISERIGSVERSLEHTRFSHPSSVLKSILEGAGEDLLIDKFEVQLVEFFKGNIFSSSFLSSIGGCPKVIDLYIEEAQNKAGSSDFDTANHFSRNVKDVDIYLAQCLSGEKAFLLIANILKAAEWGAWGAQALRNSKFSSIPRIKELVVEYINSNDVEAKEVYKEVTGDAEEYDDVVTEYVLS
ncbi:hypothetical protein [Marinobacter shengliensis]|uniref:hypothetical protein n=1 Tax=Marinobacter shengliensis TaxID=1389223 RepID=UPI000D0E8490|nr:hypothetical protein [Marinobacter shengliensis]PSF11697.1 hypothetical protein C7H10_18485 [Marinobacter shengliensis]